MFFTGDDPEKLQSLAPIIMHFRLHVLDWMQAMEYACGTEQYEKALLGIHSFKRWLDEVATPMVESVRQVKCGEPSGEPLPDIPEGELKMPRSGDIE